MEALVVLAIIAILATIAYPSYVNQVRKSKRAVAKSVLLDAANREEQYFFSNKAYTGTLTDLNYADPAYFGDDNSPSSLADAVYQLSVDTTVCGTAPCFQLQATPQHDQANDTACGTFIITSNNAGNIVKTTSTSSNDCW